MINLINNITRIGTSTGLTDETKSKVILANKINLVLIAACFLLLPLTWATPFVFSLNLMTAALYSLAFLLNALRFHSFSRFLTAVSGILMCSYFHTVTLPPGSPPSTSIVALSLAQTPLVFILFHFTELRKMMLAVTTDLLLIGSYRVLGPYLYEVGYGFPPSSTQNFYILIVSFLIIVGVLYLQVYEVRQIHRQERQAMDALKNQQHEMEETQQKLHRTLEEVQLARQEDEKRSWVNHGITRFTELLRSHHHLPDLYDSLLSGLVRYLSANQAALFVLTEEHEEAYLKLVACFAYERKKYLEQRIDLGEGLIGQTYLEGETTRLQEIPANYIRITSGLGQAAPRFLVVIPLKINDRMEGILEIASFQILEDYQIEFLEKVGESIASAITNHRVAARTQTLLEQAKVQAQELQSNEESMKLSLEELKATQEEWQRIEHAYAQRIQELEQQLAEKKVASPDA